MAMAHTTRCFITCRHTLSSGHSSVLARSLTSHPIVQLHSTPREHVYRISPNVQYTPRKFFSSTSVMLAGHSKWQNIRHIKGAKDAMKSARANRYVQDIGVAIREGGSADPKANLKLARVMERAENDDVPKQTLLNALKRAKDDKPRSVYYVDMRGPGNAALIVETHTHSVPKTKNDLTAACKKLGGRLSESNQFFFDKKGMIYLAADGMTFEAAEELAIEAGAEEVEEYTDETGQELYRLVCSDEEMFLVKKMLELKNVNIVRHETEFVPNNFVKLTPDAQELMMKLLEKIENLDDVVKVYDNVEIAEQS